MSPSSSERREVVVVGAGIAGLTAAWELRDRDVLLLEVEERVGGRIKSEPRGRYWLNLGAHVFSGPESVSGRLMTDVGVEASPVPGRLTAVALNGKIVASGRVETYPFRLPMPLAARLSLVRAGARLRAAVAAYHRLSRPRPGEAEAETRARILAFRDDRTFAEFLGPLPPDADAMFRPTINRSTAEPEKLSAGCGVGFFALVWSKGKGLSRNILGGSSTLPQAVARSLGESVATGVAVQEVASEGERVRIRFTRAGREEEVTAPYAVVATPAYEARRLIRDLPAETAEALDAVPYGPYLVMAILTGETGRMPWDGIYALATPKRSFNMLFNMASVLRAGSERREPGGSLMVYAAAGLARRLLDRSDEEIADTYLRDLYDLYPETKGIVREVLVQRWERALPYPRPGRHLLQPALERPLGNVFLAGDYLGSWYTETAAATGLAAARAVRVGLERSLAAVGR